MTTLQLIALLQMDTARFYTLRAKNVIPAPKLGDGVRKKYGHDEVQAIVKRLKEVGEIK